MRWLRRSSRADGVAVDVVGASDDGLAADVPAVVNRAVVVLSVVVVEGLGDRHQRSGGLGFGRWLRLAGGEGGGR